MTNKKSMSDEHEIIKKIRAGDREARESFIKDNQGLVVSLAKKYAFTPDIVPDLVAEGNMGLLKALDKFDFSKNVKFVTYAYYWIKRFILRAMLKEFELFRIPEKYHELGEDLSGLEKTYMMKYGRPPTDKEIGDHFDLPHELVKKIKKYSENVKISSDFYNGEKDVDLFDVIDFNNHQDRALWQIFTEHDIIEKIFERLRRKEKKADIERWINVLDMHYGLNGSIQYSYKEIAEKMGVSRQRVHQIIKVCIKKLREEWEEMKDEQSEELDSSNT